MQIQQYKIRIVNNDFTFYHNLLFYTMSFISNEDIPNVKENVIKIIQEIFYLSFDERNNISEQLKFKGRIKK